MVLIHMIDLNKLKIKERNMQIKGKKNYIFTIMVVFMSIIFGTLVSGAQPLLEQPTIKNIFRLGEILEYNVKVRGIPAGTQIMQIEGQKNISGREVYHLSSRSTVNKFFSLIYTFDDQSESFVLKDRLYPVRYRRNLIDGRYSGNTVIDIDDNSRTAKIVKDSKNYKLSVPIGIQDELSMLYLIRTKNLKVGEEYRFPAVIGTKVFDVGVIVLRTENIKTIFGDKKTIVVKSLPRNALLWITQDEDRIPVKLEVSTKIGKLVAELKDIS
jgi:hypothetical protein